MNMVKTIFRLGRRIIEIADIVIHTPRMLLIRGEPHRIQRITMAVLQVNREDNDKRNDTTHNGNDDGARRSKNTLYSISNDIIYSSYQK